MTFICLEKVGGSVTGDLPVQFLLPPGMSVCSWSQYSLHMVSCPGLCSAPSVATQHGSAAAALHTPFHRRETER